MGEPRQNPKEGPGAQLAIEALLERHLPGLRAFVRLRAGPAVRTRESTTDVVQSACREVLAHFDRFRFPSEIGFKQWLYKTALRKILEHERYYRAEKRTAAREVEAPDHDQQALLASYRSFCTPSRVAMAAEEVERIEHAFDQLSDDHREVIVLARILALSHAEIAEQMGRSEVAVRTLLSRALARLLLLLGDGDKDGSHGAAT